VDIESEKETAVADSIQGTTVYLLKKISDTYALKHSNPAIQ
jgi:hypothetical protein